MSLPSYAEADQFFTELHAFWKRLRDKVMTDAPNITPNTTTWRGNGSKPAGAVLHYTAGTSWRSAVRWFLLFKKASAHVVVCDKLIAEAKDLVSDLPLVKRLPVTVIQLHSPMRGTWHATWANKFCYGIENRNLGMVKRDNASAPWRWWKNDWTALAPNIPGKEYVAQNSFTGFEPYSDAQLKTNVILLRYLRAWVRGPMIVTRDLDPRLVLPHSCYQGNKRDVGPLYPVDKIRDLVFSDHATDEDIDAAFSDQSDVDEELHYDADEELCLAATADDRHDAWGDEPEQDKGAADGALAYPGAASTLSVVMQVRANLSTLGYFVPALAGDDALDAAIRKALWIFQYAHKIPTSGKPDSRTRVRIVERLDELGLPVA